MRSCWNEKPEERPSFSELRKVMKEMGSKREVQNSYCLYILKSSPDQSH